MMNTRTYNSRQAAEAQKKYCSENKVPVFAPGEWSKYRCIRCFHDIYREGGISVEEAGKKLITGCPFCNYSFCN